MDTADIIVVIGGLVAIAWVLWYFFFGERERTQAALTESQQLTKTLNAQKKRTEDALGRSRKLAATLTTVNQSLADEQKHTKNALAEAASRWSLRNTSTIWPS